MKAEPGGSNKNWSPEEFAVPRVTQASKLDRSEKILFYWFASTSKTRNEKGMVGG